MILRSMHVDLLVVMAIGIRFSSIHNNYYHYQQNMTPENYKIKVLLRTEGFFRQRKNSISKIYSTTGSFNRYETGLGPTMGVAVGGVERLYTGRFQLKVYRDFAKLAVSSRWR